MTGLVYNDDNSEDAVFKQVAAEQESLLLYDIKEESAAWRDQSQSSHRGLCGIFEPARKLSNILMILSIVLSLSAITIIYVQAITWNANHRSVPYRSSRFSGKDDLATFVRPVNQSIIGIVFAGRYETTHILNTYLERNLVRNGGWLDEIVWIMRTRNQNDTNYIEALVNSTANYKCIKDATSYEDSYKIVERGKIYIKIDDDIVFMEDHTIPALVKRLTENPEYSLVSANVINQPATAWIHHHLGAVHPYLPELTKAMVNKLNMSTAIDGTSDEAIAIKGSKSTSDWRASSLPYWQGPASFVLPPTFINPTESHRWLPLKSLSALDRTPINAMGHRQEYHGFSLGWNKWLIAAQEHYSFLQNLEKEELWRYKFDVWDFRYERLSINLIAFFGDLIIDNRPFVEDDEKYLTTILPKKLHRPAVMDGTAIAAHFSFSPQSENIHKTDLLQRYEAFAYDCIQGNRLNDPRRCKSNKS